MVVQDRHYRFAVVFGGYEPHARSFGSIRQTLRLISIYLTFDICLYFTVNRFNMNA